jgi:hypothetical protein
MQSGARQANYTLNIAAMDAAGVYSSLLNNLQTFGSSLQSAIGFGRRIGTFGGCGMARCPSVIIAASLR